MALPLYAAPVQTVESIRAAVLAYLEAQAPTVSGAVHVEVGALDPRLQLPLCPAPLQTSFAAGAKALGNVNVGVRCQGAAGWSVYVPARVEVHDKIAVVTHALSRGAVLSAADLELVEQDVTSLAGSYYTDLGLVVGKALKRPVTAGTPLVQTLVQEPRLVKRGDRVTLLARTPGFEVRMEGEALEDGGRGDRIRARNLKSKREVQGLVVEPGTVEIRL